MLHSLEWEGGNEPDANLSLCYIPWSPHVTFLGVEREGMSEMPISPCVTFLGVEGRELARCQSFPVLHSLESKGGNETDANHSLSTFLGVGGRE